MRAKIFKDEDDALYVLFSPVNQNSRQYRYYADEVLENVLYVGIFRFREVEYNGKIYSERGLKLKQIKNRLKDEIR